MGVNISEDAIRDAQNWIITAETMAEKGVYNTVLYSEEMAVEIALKAVALSVEVEPPKVHNITGVMENIVIKSAKFPEKYKDDVKRLIKELLPELLRTRQMSGYTFNYNIDEDDLKSLAMKYLQPTKEAVELCKRIVDETGNKKKRL